MRHNTHGEHGRAYKLFGAIDGGVTDVKEGLSMAEHWKAVVPYLACWMLDRLAAAAAGPVYTRRPHRRAPRRSPLLQAFHSILSDRLAGKRKGRNTMLPGDGPRGGGGGGG